jgi:hypothetical protein
MTDWAVVAAIVIVAPMALVLLFAILRGYAVHLTMRRDRKDDSGD